MEIVNPIGLIIFVIYLGLNFFSGMAGTVYFLADILEPHSSKFPAFE